MKKILYLQSKLIAEAEGAKASDTKTNEVLQRKIFAMVKAEPAGPELVKKLLAMAKEEVDHFTPEQKKEMDKQGGMAALTASLGEFTKPWFKTS